MPTLLHLDASPRGEFSISRQLSKAGVAAWKTRYPNGKVIERDLTKTQMTFVDLDWIMGAFSPPEQVTEQHKSALAISDTLIGELLTTGRQESTRAETQGPALTEDYKGST